MNADVFVCVCVYVYIYIYIYIYVHQHSPTPTPHPAVYFQLLHKGIFISLTMVAPNIISNQN